MDVGILLLREVEQCLRVADRLAACMEDPRAPELITHTLADIVRFRLLMIGAGFPASKFSRSLACSSASFSSAVPCRPLADICAEHVRGDIHFLKVDVEGAEKSVLVGCDFKRLRPWLLAIEATEPCTYTPSHEEWEHLVLGAGYEFALFHQINQYVNSGVKTGKRGRVKPGLFAAERDAPMSPAWVHGSPRGIGIAKIR